MIGIYLNYNLKLQSLIKFKSYIYFDIIYMPHRWSLRSTGVIKSYNNGKLIKKDKSLLENNLVNNLLDLGFTYEQSIGCLAYLEVKDLNHALDFFHNFED